MFYKSLKNLFASELFSPQVKINVTSTIPVADDRNRARGRQPWASRSGRDASLPTKERGARMKLNPKGQSPPLCPRKAAPAASHAVTCRLPGAPGCRRRPLEVSAVCEAPPLNTANTTYRNLSFHPPPASSSGYHNTVIN